MRIARQQQGHEQPSPEHAFLLKAILEHPLIACAVEAGASNLRNRYQIAAGAKQFLSRIGLLFLNLAQNGLSVFLVCREPYAVPYPHCAGNETISEAVLLCAFAQMPKVETIIMPSGGFWGGVGEPTIAVKIHRIVAATDPGHAVNVPKLVPQELP